MTDQPRQSTYGKIKNFLGVLPNEITDSLNCLVDDLNVQIDLLNAAIASISGIGALGGDLTGFLPNPTIAALAVTNAKMASGAAATNVGSLGGDLTGTLPNPTIASAAVTNSKLAAGVATANIGALGGVLSGTLPNPAFAGGISLLAWFNVKSYGALGDGATDDTTAINAAIAAANSAGPSSILYFPASTGYVISAGLTTISCNVLGDGPQASIILAPITVSPFTLSTSGVPQAIMGLTVTYASSANSGTTALTMQCTGGGYSIGPIIRDVYINNPYNGVLWSNLAHGLIDNLQVNNTGNVSLTLQAPANTDIGGHTINGCQFWGGGTTGTGVLWTSGGGCKFVSNKFANLNYGVQITLGNAVTTSQLLFNGNSFDIIATTGVSISRSGTGNLEHVMINNNVFNLVHKGINVITSGAAYLFNLTAVGNIFYGDAVNGGYFVAMDAVDNIVVTNNACWASASGSNTTLYIISSQVTGGVIGPNPKIGTWAANQNTGSGITIIAPN